MVAAMTELPMYETTLSQVDSELDGLIGILVAEKVTRFLEVGSRYGGSLWRIANALPKGSVAQYAVAGPGMAMAVTGFLALPVWALTLSRAMSRRPLVEPARAAAPLPGIPGPR